MELGVELEEAILAGEHVALREERLLLVDDRLQAREILLARVHGRELCHARLDQATGLQDAGDLVHSQLRLRWPPGRGVVAAAERQAAQTAQPGRGLLAGLAAERRRSLLPCGIPGRGFYLGRVLRPLG